MLQPFINGYFQREPADGITVYHLVDGEPIIYAEYDDPWDFLRRSYYHQTLSNNLDGPTTREYTSYIPEVCADIGPIVAYWNCDGTLYDIDQIIGDHNKYYPFKPSRWHYRCGFKSGGRYSCRWRHFKTTQERRMSYTWISDLEELADCHNQANFAFSGHIDPRQLQPRGKRKDRSLPSVWDDCYRSSTKSWKKHRKTQWKEKR